MTEIPSLYLIFAIAAFFLDGDPAVDKFTVASYSPDDPYTFTRVVGDSAHGDGASASSQGQGGAKGQVCWELRRAKGLEFGRFMVRDGVVTVEQGGKVVERCEVKPKIEYMAGDEAGGTGRAQIKYQGLRVRRESTDSGVSFFLLEGQTQRTERTPSESLFPIVVVRDKE